MGQLKRVKIKLHLDEKVQPVAQLERRIPIALKDKAKQQSKSYTDSKHHTTKWKIQSGDQVLVKQRKLNKLTTSFDIAPHYVTAIKVSVVTAQATSINKVITRIISHYKPLPNTAELPKKERRVGG